MPGTADGANDGAVVGTVDEALDFLMEIRLDEGEISADEAAVRLHEWWKERNEQ